MFVEVPVLAQIARGEQLCDEVDAVALLVLPALKAFDDVWVLQVQALGHLADYLLQLFITQMVWLCADLAPGHINADLSVKGLVDLLEAPLTHHLSVPGTGKAQHSTVSLPMLMLLWSAKSCRSVQMATARKLQG